MNFQQIISHPVTIAFGAIIFGVLLHFLVAKLCARLIQKKVIDFKGASYFLDYLRDPLAVLFPSLAFYIVMPLLGMSTAQNDSISHVINLWLIGNVGWFGSRLLRAIKEMIISQFIVTEADNLRARKIHTQIRVTQRILNVLLIIIVLACMLMTFDSIRQFGTSILASAGVIGIIFGFAAQKSISTIFAGLQIAITQPIRIDDVVIVEGEWGWIEEITLTYVVVKIWDLRRLVVPITYFLEKPFQNWTRISADILGTVYLYTDYTIPVEPVRQELKAILDSTDLWDKKAWCLQVTNATEQTVELRALMSAADSPKAWDLRCLVREKLLEYLKENHPRHLARTRIELNRRS